VILLQDVLGNFSTVELAWTLIALLGMAVAFVNGREAIVDYQALEGKRNGRRVVAIGNIRRETIRIFADLVFLAVGIYAGLTPANPAATFTGLLVTLALVIGSLGFNLNSWLDRADRIYLMRYGLQPRDDAGRFTKEQ
jgi:4-hydroxybenzoate polyprenyltransferase